MEVLPGLVVDPASVALYPITTFVVVLTYIALDAEETRKVAYGVVISNLAVYGVAALAGWHLVIDGHQNLLALPPALFTQSLGVALTSTAALFLDVVSAIVVFEVVSRRLHSMFLRLWVTASAGDVDRQRAVDGGTAARRPEPLADVRQRPGRQAGRRHLLCLRPRRLFALRGQARRGDDRRALEPRRLPPADLPAALREGAQGDVPRRADRAVQPRLLRRAGRPPSGRMSSAPTT